MTSIAILCASKKSIYHELDFVDVYDEDRDARTFKGDLPVVAHPPCRAWSAYCAHQAKPDPGEKELGIWCVEQLRECGGILEHPAHSRLFDAADMPKPGEQARGGLWSMAVNQSWWGDKRIKRTWLCFSQIEMHNVEIPFRLHDPKGDRNHWNVMSKRQRSATNEKMAIWMVETAKQARPPETS